MNNKSVQHGGTREDSGRKNKDIEYGLSGEIIKSL